MSALPRATSRRIIMPLLSITAGAAMATTASAQSTAAATSPIAIVSIDSSDPAKAANVTGALEIYGGRAFIGATGTITSGNQPTRVILPHRGEMRVCAMSSIKLATDSSSAAAGETPGLLMAMDQGAVEMSYATTAGMKIADTLLTPDFRILIGGPGAADVKVRLGSQGDTCVDNAGANGPYIVVSSVFDGGAYRVQPGQRVMFQHGSLREVVDQEKEACGCPAAAPAGNEFPEAQSMGLAPASKVAPAPAVNADAQTQAQSVPPLVFKADEHAPAVDIPPQPALTPITVTSTAPPKAASASQKKSGFFAKVGHFFRKVFGAES